MTNTNDKNFLQRYKNSINKANLPSRAVAQFWYIIADYQKIEGSCDTLFATNFLQHQISWWSDFVMAFCNYSNYIGW